MVGEKKSEENDDLNAMYQALRNKLQEAREADPKTLFGLNKILSSEENHFPLKRWELTQIINYKEGEKVKDFTWQQICLLIKSLPEPFISTNSNPIEKNVEEGTYNKNKPPQKPFDWIKWNREFIDLLLEIQLKTKFISNVQTERELENQLEKCIKQKECEEISITKIPEATVTKLESLYSKFEHISKEDANISLIGGVYIDLVAELAGAAPSLDSKEIFSQLEIKPGGSVLFLGKYLKEYTQKSSFLYSIAGESDQEFWDLLKNFNIWDDENSNGWAKNRILKKLGKTARTIHVKFWSTDNNDNKVDLSYMVITDRGLLSSFTLSDIVEDLFVDLRDGGVCFIGSYLRGQFYQDLLPMLQILENGKTVFILENGYQDSDDTPHRAYKTLAQVFRMGIIDIFVTSIQELIEYVNVVNDQKLDFNLEDRDDIKKLLCTVVGLEIPLPTLVFLRDEKFYGTIAVLIGQKFIFNHFEADATHRIVGHKNRATASFINALLFKSLPNREDDNIHQKRILHLKECVATTAEQWASQPPNPSDYRNFPRVIS